MNKPYKKLNIKYYMYNKEKEKIYFHPNPKICLEKKIYDNIMKKDNKEALRFLNNFCLNHMVENQEFTMRSRSLNEINKDKKIITFENLFDKLGIPKNEYSLKLNNSRISSFYNKIDSMLEEKKLLGVNEFPENYWNFLSSTSKRTKSVFEIYQSLREEGYHRYKDLIA